jgi:hypothetical protein
MMPVGTYPYDEGTRPRQQLDLYHADYNICLPHASLRPPLPQPLPTNVSGLAKRWRPCTPAIAAGLMDHVWTLREVLSFRVPPWPQPLTLQAAGSEGDRRLSGPGVPTGRERGHNQAL